MIGTRMVPLAALIVFAGSACVDHSVDPKTGSETHWMEVCVVPETCGEESDCVCNVCAKGCESDADCQQSGPLTRCALPGDPELTLMCGQLLPVRGGLCLAPCATDTECNPLEASLAFSLECAERRCIPSDRGGERKVDILWVVDNSGSMCEEQQSLRQEFGSFAAVMAGTTIDFQMAVITTDLEDPQQTGRFQNLPDGTPGPSCSVAVDISSCPSETGEGAPPLIISSRDRRYRDIFGNLEIELMQRDFGCTATTGTAGSGFEMGLEAARVALSEPLLSGNNSGFLREDANLAVVFVTDENDCSDGGVLDRVNGNICEWESDQLIPTDDYVAFFGSLKRDMFGAVDRSRVVMASISAADSGIRYEYGQDVDPSCITDTGRAFSGYRYDSVVRAFPNSVQGDVCEPPFADVLSEIAQAIVDSFEN